MSMADPTSLHADEQLQAYLDFVRERQEETARTKPSDSTVRKVAKHLVPKGFRGRARFLATDVMTPYSRARARRIAAEHNRTGAPLWLHLGSGGEHKDGWVNIDLAGDPVEVAWNMKRGIPFPEQSASAIFTEHVLEHIPLPGVAATLGECLRVLRPGGVLRIGVPDAGSLLKSYVDSNEKFIDVTRPDRPQRILAVQELFYWYGHCTMYDFSMMEWLLHATGFTKKVVRCEPGASDHLDAPPDTPRRFDETLYVETVRP